MHEQAGGLAAEEGALRQHEPGLLRYAWRLTGNEQSARDVVQETFLRAIREPSTQLNGRLASWLYRCCRHRAFDLLRKERRMSPLESAATPSEQTEPSAAAELRDERARLTEAVARLPAREQEIVRLRFEQGLGNREIAEVLELSATNVGYLLHQALRKLRSTLG